MGNPASEGRERVAAATRPKSANDGGPWQSAELAERGAANEGGAGLAGSGVGAKGARLGEPKRGAGAGGCSGET
jgi:hypothetical protein